MIDRGPREVPHSLLSVKTEQGPTSRLSTRAAAVAPWLAYLAIVCFYFWTASTSGAPAAPAAAIGEHYSFLARGYLAGQLNLSVAPDPHLLALPDPYDPAANVSFRLHDAALFNGRYYLYSVRHRHWSIFAPFRLATRWTFRNRSPRLCAVPWDCCLLSSFCGTSQFIFSATSDDVLVGCWRVRVGVQQRHAVPPPAARHVQSGHLVRLRARAGEHVLLRERRSGVQPRLGRLALGSAVLGLAGGARFPLLAAGVVPVSLGVYHVWRNRALGIRPRDVAGGPLCARGDVYLAPGLVHDARFGSWTEFGISYTLQGVNPNAYEFFSLRRLPYRAHYIAVPVKWSGAFSVRAAHTAADLTPPSYLYVEPVAGLLAHSPLLVILAALPWLRPSDARLVAALLVSLVLGSGWPSSSRSPARQCVTRSTSRLLRAPGARALGPRAAGGALRHATLVNWRSLCGAIRGECAVQSVHQFHGVLRQSQNSPSADLQALRDFFSPVERLFADD